MKNFYFFQIQQKKQNNCQISIFGNYWCCVNRVAYIYILLMYSYLWRYLYFSIWSNNVFYVYVLECFVLVELYKLVVKAVWKLAYRQILVAFCARSKASKALKGFCLFFSNFIATVIIKFHFIGQKKHPNTCICAIFVVILQRKIVWYQTIKHHNNNLCDFELVFWQPC